MSYKLIPRFNIDYDVGDFISNLFPNNKFINNDELNKIFGDKDFFFTNSGRSSLYIILKSLGIPKGSRIGVPLYSCSVVFDAIIKAGFIPEFIDINLDNYTIDTLDLEKKIDNLKAVIVIHTFGRPAYMDELKNIAGDVPIIEDCAHSLLSEYKGKMAGILGTASFFSFKKYPSAGEGGMIILNDTKFKENLKNIMNTLKMPSNIDEIRHALLTYAHSVLYHKPLYGLLAYPVGSRILDEKLKVTSFEATLAKKGDMAVFIKKLRKLKEKIKIQRGISLFLIEKLKDTSLVLPCEAPDTFCNYFLFPVRLRDKEMRDQMHINLRKLGVDSAKLFSLAPQAAKFYGYKGDCLNAEKCADTILVIPNHSNLKSNELYKIYSSIRLLS